MSKAIRLRCEYNTNPVGVQTDRPRFSWELETDRLSRRQVAYRIVVSENEADVLAGTGKMWDSGWVESAETFHQEYAGSPLRSGHRYYWAVCCLDQDGQLYQAEAAAYFDMGILSPDEWSARWIGADEAISAPMFRKVFCIAKAVKRAALCISGLGYFELYMNGQQVGDHVLVPNWTDYDTRRIEGLLYPFDDQTDKRVHYIQHSVANRLKQGENTIGIMLGNGFYNQTERTVEGKMRYGAPKLMMQLDIAYKDGTNDRIVSDPSWTCSSGPIVFNNVFYGEVYDARLEQAGWTEDGFDDSCWDRARLVLPPAGRLMAQMSPPDKRIGTMPPISRIEVRPGVYVFDFGQNISGWVRIRVKGKAGHKITLRFAENVKGSGELDPASCGGESQMQADTYILRGEGVEQYEPRFVWHGFRYAEVASYPGIPELEDLDGIVVHASVESIGQFSCSEPLLNQVQSAYRWSQLTNLHGGVPSDCPHRERLGYTGDGHLTAEAAIYNFDMSALYTKWTHDIGDAQNKQTGFVPHTAPFNGGGGGVAWGSAYILMPWTMYRMYGDKRILAEHYEGMKKWIDYLGTRNTGGYLVEFEEPDSWFLGDWCIPGTNELPAVLVSTFYYAYTLNIMAQIAETIGSEEDSRQFKMQYRLVCDSFNEAFFDPESAAYSIGRQGSDVFPLVLDCVPDGYTDRVWQRVLHYYRDERGGRLDTGIFGTSFLLELLSERGETDLALEMVMSKSYPGYGYMIDKGATTLWESWDGHDSHNHPMFGTVSAWFYKHVAGLALHPKAVAFRQVVFRPFRANRLSDASASIHTLLGRYAARWSRENNEAWECEIQIPPGGTAEVYLPLYSHGSRFSEISERSKGVIWPPTGSSSSNTPHDGKMFEEEMMVIVLDSGQYKFQLSRS